MNTLKTTFLLASLTALLVICGNMLGGSHGASIALIIALSMNLISYWFSDKIVLSMYRAKEVSESDVPNLYRIVKNLTEKNQMPMPKVYIINSESPNAFATGRNPEHAAVAATVGILRILTDDELEGVMAHELAHVRNRDTLTSTIAASIAGAITWLANIIKWSALFGGGMRDNDDNRGGALGALAMAVLAPLAAMLIQLAISRSREYAADESGARMSGKPLALSSALSKLHRSVEIMPMRSGEPSTAHLFIVNPFKGGFASLFSTHPPMEERIKRLKILSAEI
ncbi:MAG: zinc metalloprotease HtpX [Fibrobacter sp.]|nr:zinc metalloprotease HtpX [Fibrobacter sp.]